MSARGEISQRERRRRGFGDWQDGEEEDEERDDEHRSALCLRHLQDFTDDVIIT